LKVPEVFSSIAEKYDAWYRSELGEHVLNVESRLLELVLPSEGIGLDAGCGSGIFIEKLRTSRRRIIGLDLSRGLLEIAKHRRLEVVFGDVYHPPLMPIFDFIYMITVLEFLPDPSGALSSLKHLLKSGSIMAVIVINRESEWGLYYLKKKREGDRIFRHANLYSVKEVYHLFEKVGFKDIVVYTSLKTRPKGIPLREEYKLLTSLNSRDGVLLLAGVKPSNPNF